MPLLNKVTKSKIVMAACAYGALFLRCNIHAQCSGGFSHNSYNPFALFYYLIDENEAQRGYLFWITQLLKSASKAQSPPYDSETIPFNCS